MINLLPKQEKNNIKREYKARLFTVAMFFVFILVVFSTVLIFSLYITLSAKEDVANKQLESLLLSSEDEFTLDFLSNANKKLLILNLGDTQEFVYEDVFNAIMAEKGKISITNISYQKDNDGTPTVRVVGVSPDRDTLLNFVKVLEQKRFSQVDVPVSNFVKIQDLEFSLDIKI